MNVLSTLSLSWGYNCRLAESETAVETEKQKWEDERRKVEEEVKQLQEKHAKEDQQRQELKVEVERLKKEVFDKTQYARERSTTAQKLVAEKEAKVSDSPHLISVKYSFSTSDAHCYLHLCAALTIQMKALTSRLEELEAEVACGGHSERKIMELAAAQAKREALQKTELGSYTSGLKKAKEQLEAKVGTIPFCIAEAFHS